MAVLFSDGFESGDFSAWTGTSGPPTVTTATAHHGSYSCLVDASLEGVYKTITSSYIVYMRVYMRFNNLPTSPNTNNWVSPRLRSATATICNVMVGLDASGNTRWGLWVTNTLYWAASQTIQTGVWYCVEVGISVNDDRVWLWVDGVLQCTSTKDLGTEPIVACWLHHQTNTGPVQTIYYDCAVIADAYIGPEAAFVQVSDPIGLSEVALCNKAVALSDLFALADFSCGDKLFLLSDAAGLSELASALKSVKVKDALMLNDYASMPLQVSRVLEAIGLADNVAVFKVLLVSEAVALVEAVDSGVGGASKTRLFLIIGDLAVQLTGE